MQWEKSSDNKILKGAIKGGRTEGVRTLPLYIARCENGQSNYKFVKITQSTTDEILFIGPNGTKWDKDKCQILTCSSWVYKDEISKLLSLIVVGGFKDKS